MLLSRKRECAEKKIIQDQYGHGVAQDYKKAFKWYFKSAKNGCAISQYIIQDIFYQHGRGVSQNYKKEFKWLSKSVNNGCVKGR